MKIQILINFVMTIIPLLQSIHKSITSYNVVLHITPLSNHMCCSASNEFIKIF